VEAAAAVALAARVHLRFDFIAEQHFRTADRTKLRKATTHHVVVENVDMPLAIGALQKKLFCFFRLIEQRPNTHRKFTHLFYYTVVHAT